MKNRKGIPICILVVFLVALFSGSKLLFSLFIPSVFAHCDMMDGPVIKDAQRALETGNINPVLAWVPEKDETDIKQVFEKTRKVRRLSPQAKELADMYFFETLVRLHREAEGAPYTGIKPAGSEYNPAINTADKALESGSSDNLIKEITASVVSGIQERFNHAMELKKHTRESVQAGREYVEAYVTFIHYIEKLHFDATNKQGHSEEPVPRYGR